MANFTRGPKVTVLWWFDVCEAAEDVVNVLVCVCACMRACVCRAAAHSKLGNYAGAVQDCEQAISIDPNYSKAYGRMGYETTCRISPFALRQ